MSGKLAAIYLMVSCASKRRRSTSLNLRMELLTAEITSPKFEIFQRFVFLSSSKQQSFSISVSFFQVQKQCFIFSCLIDSQHIPIK